MGCLGDSDHITQRNTSTIVADMAWPSWFRAGSYFAFVSKVAHDWASRNADPLEATATQFSARPSGRTTNLTTVSPPRAFLGYSSFSNPFHHDSTSIGLGRLANFRSATGSTPHDI